MIAGLPSAAIFGQTGRIGGLPRRAGLVHVQGRSFFDDTGWFHPLGTTLFWAAIGYRSERDHLEANLKWLSGRVDYIRILGEVGWPGRDIIPPWKRREDGKPVWLDYAAVMGALIDLAYDKYGIRTQVTLMGGGTETDPRTLAREWCAIVAARAHKVFLVEDSNEYFQNGPDEATLDDMSTILARALVSTNPIAPSSPAGGDVATVERLMSTRANSVAVGHLDRSDGDRTPENGGPSWREVRQSWDWRDLKFPGAHNEPKGPRSSIAEQVNPYVLAMLRAVGIMNGLDAFVLHCGPGVTGAPDPGRNRPASIYDLPDIDSIFKAVRTAGELMPVGCGDWLKYNGHWAGHPLPADQVWTDPGMGDHGIIRTYGAVRDGRFVTTPHGVRNFVNLKALYACTLTAFNPTDGTAIWEGSLEAGQALRLNGPEKGGIPAYIVVGAYR